MAAGALIAVPATTVRAAGTGWAIEQTPDHLSRFGLFTGVSCLSSILCTAVGEYPTSSAAFSTLAESWNGVRWKREVSPNPANVSNELDGVSCTSATTCIAVGFSQEVIHFSPDLNSGIRSGGPEATPAREAPSSTPPNNGLSGSSLAESWNGTSWAIQTTPNPTGALTTQFNGVSCNAGADSTGCMAVGSTTTKAGVTSTLAESWNGSNWVMETTPNPTGAVTSLLNGVSCVSVTRCVAVGSSTDASGTTTELAELWDGTNWTVLPSTSASVGDALFAVSCSGPTSCTAVGSSTNVTTTTTLAQYWDGSTWTIETTPNPTRGVYSELYGVSCMDSSTTCTAVGDSVNTSGTGVTLAESLTTAGWSTVPTPTNAGSNSSYLASISCTEPTACTAVGDRSDTWLGESWSGGKWTASSPPVLSSTNNDLTGVSCLNPSDCEAVGNYQTSSESLSTLVEYWNGAQWVIQRTPDAINSQFLAISCPGASSCTAVGSRSQRIASDTAPLAESWDGTLWTTEATADPTGAVESQLNGVSCLTSSCIAVGSTTSGSGTTTTLAESWNGANWVIEATPVLSGVVDGQFASVSCSGPKACVAVGSQQSASGVKSALAEVWDGATWTVQSLPQPGRAGTYISELAGISCAAARTCEAVGSFDSTTAQTTVTLAEVWNGTTWTIQSTPNQGGDTVDELNGVSCASTVACTATAVFTGTGGYPEVAAESWANGSWTRQKPPIPPGTKTESYLNGLSCSAPDVCTAVGDYFLSDPNRSISLAEAEPGG